MNRMLQDCRLVVEKYWNGVCGDDPSWVNTYLDPIIKYKGFNEIEARELMQKPMSSLKQAMELFIMLIPKYDYLPLGQVINVTEGTNKGWKDFFRDMRCVFDIEGSIMNMQNYNEVQGLEYLWRFERSNDQFTFELNGDTIYSEGTSEFNMNCDLDALELMMDKLQEIINQLKNN